MQRDRFSYPNPSDANALLSAAFGVLASGYAKRVPANVALSAAFTRQFEMQGALEGVPYGFLVYALINCTVTGDLRAQSYITGSGVTNRLTFMAPSDIASNPLLSSTAAPAGGVNAAPAGITIPTSSSTAPHVCLAFGTALKPDAGGTLGIDLLMNPGSANLLAGSCFFVWRLNP